MRIIADARPIWMLVPLSIIWRKRGSERVASTVRSATKANKLIGLTAGGFARTNGINDSADQQRQPRSPFLPPHASSTATAFLEKAEKRRSRCVVLFALGSMSVKTELAPSCTRMLCTATLWLVGRLGRTRATNKIRGVTGYTVANITLT